MSYHPIVVTLASWKPFFFHSLKKELGFPNNAWSIRPRIQSERAAIALWLGHESLETAHVYLEIDLAHKEQALHKLIPIDGPMAPFTTPDPHLRQDKV
jgi:hypothetical protein